MLARKKQIAGSLGVNPADAVMLISLSKPNENNKTD